MSAETAGKYFEDDNYEMSTKADYSRRMTSGESNWKHINRVSKEDRNSAIQGLEKFQIATGINEKKHIEDLRKANSPWEIMQKQNKIKRAGLSWYEKQINQSGIFEPIDGREAEGLNRERKELLEWVASLPLAGSESNLIDAILKIEELIQAKKAFRNKLKNQSSVVLNDYFRRLPEIALFGGREELLNDVLRSYKGVEEAPAAVQFEFKKKQQGANSKKDTESIKKEVMAEYTKRSKQYQGEILKNQAVFGGDIVKSKWGKIPLTAREFLEWFDEQESFAAMDYAISKLPKLISDRKNLCEQRDAILKDAKDEDKPRLLKLTKKMRRHELEKYLPTLKKSVKEDSIHTAEYEGEILTARSKEVDVFGEFERELLVRQFKLNDPKTQKIKLKALKIEIAERKRVIKEYMSLPPHVRNDGRFINEHGTKRAQMLMEALEKLANEPQKPFDLEKLDFEAIEDIADDIEGAEGQQVMNQIMEELEQEGEVNEYLEAVYRKIYGTAKRAEIHNEDQEESYLRDLRYWIRLDQEKKDESDAVSDREKGKIRFMDEAKHAYDLGYVMSSSGIIQKKQEVSETELLHGNQKIEEKIGRARYGEHVQINRADGSMASDPLEMIERLSEAQLQHLVLIAIKKLSQKHMGLGESGTSMIQNSAQVKKAMRNRIINDEHAHLSQLKKAA